VQRESSESAATGTRRSPGSFGDLDPRCLRQALGPLWLLQTTFFPQDWLQTSTTSSDKLGSFTIDLVTRDPVTPTKEDKAKEIRGAQEEPTEKLGLHDQVESLCKDTAKTRAGERTVGSKEERLGQEETARETTTQEEASSQEEGGKERPKEAHHHQAQEDLCQVPSHQQVNNLKKKNVHRQVLFMSIFLS